MTIAYLFRSSAMQLVKLKQIIRAYSKTKAFTVVTTKGTSGAHFSVTLGALNPSMTLELWSLLHPSLVKDSGQVPGKDPKAKPSSIHLTYPLLVFPMGNFCTASQFKESWLSNRAAKSFPVLKNQGFKAIGRKWKISQYSNRKMKLKGCKKKKKCWVQFYLSA